MFAVIGITGQVGGAVAEALLGMGQKVRAVVRSAARGADWERKGCDIAVADVADAAALEEAFAGVEGVFVMLPPHFDPAPDFAEARKIAASLRKALAAARPPKVVCLSTIGAQAKQANLLTQLQILEQEVGTLELPVAFLRPAWFMENAAWDVAPARTTGAVPSFLQPLDRAVPMVAVADVGQTAAGLLREVWQGKRIVELEGPGRVTPNDIAAAFTLLLGREVRMQAVPRDEWEPLFQSQGMKNPKPRMRMIDGFNEGWIEFEGGDAQSRKGQIALEVVLCSLIERTK